MLISQATHNRDANHQGIGTEQNVAGEKNAMDHVLMIKEDVVEAEAEVANEEGIFSWLLHDFDKF